MERVFSVVNIVFGAQQTTIIWNDMFELTVMLRHYYGIRRGTMLPNPNPSGIRLPLVGGQRREKGVCMLSVDA